MSILSHVSLQFIMYLIIALNMCFNMWQTDRNIERKMDKTIDFTFFVKCKRKPQKLKTTLPYHLLLYSLQKIISQHFLDKTLICMYSQWLWGLVQNIKAVFLLQGSFIVSFISYLHTMCYLVLFSEKIQTSKRKVIFLSRR